MLEVALSQYQQQSLLRPLSRKNFATVLLLGCRVPDLVLLRKGFHIESRIAAQHTCGHKQCTIRLHQACIDMGGAFVLGVLFSMRQDGLQTHCQLRVFNGPVVLIAGVWMLRKKLWASAEQATWHFDSLDVSGTNWPPAPGSCL